MNRGGMVPVIVLGALTLFPIDWVIATAVAGAAPPGLDPNVVFTSVFAAVPGLAAAFVAFLAWRSSEETKRQSTKAAVDQGITKDLVDGITSKRLEEVAAAAKAEGITEGRAAELARQAADIQVTAKAAADVLATARATAAVLGAPIPQPPAATGAVVTLPSDTPVTLIKDTEVRPA